jgi:hypothetical protein
VVGLTRRGFLLGVSAAGVLLSGCGVDEAGTAPPTDADVLGGLLDVEAAAGAAVIGSPVAELLARQDERHAGRLAELAGVAPPLPGSREAVELSTALARKQEAVFAYVAALPAIAEPDTRVALMQILASEAGHMAALREAAGDDAVPDPFAGFTEVP